MIDTIKLFLATSEETQTKYFDSIREVVDLQPFRRGIEGRLKNIHIKIVKSGIFIEGSLIKYALGQNLININIDRVRKTIKELEKTLGIPVRDAKVFRVDVAASIPLKKPLVCYLNCLAYCNLHVLYDINNKETLMFLNKSNQLLFYDKLIEMKKSGENIDAKLLDKHILRFEVQIKKNLKRQLRMSEIIAKDLYDPQVYRRLIRFWYNKYMSVKKTYKNKLTLLDCTNVKSLEQTLASYM